jgi:hypothetical protein
MTIQEGTAILVKAVEGDETVTMGEIVDAYETVFNDGRMYAAIRSVLEEPPSDDDRV